MGTSVGSAPRRAARILHVITGLDVGGAETSLQKLLATLDRSRFEPSVVSLKGHGTMAKKIARLDVPVYSARIHEPGARLAGLRELFRTVGPWAPDLIQGWMYHGNLAALAFARLAPGRPPAIWNVRHSIDRLKDEKTSTRWVIRAGSLFSRRARRIIYNSHISSQQHERLGYSQHGTIVIPNGFDTDCFKPSAEHRRHIRETLGISADAFVAGIVARYHPMKDHPVFIEAAKQVRAAHLDTIFLLAGSGVTRENSELGKAATLALGSSVRLLGERDDMPALMAALDVLVSASAYGEGFPNVVGEAMASGVPCVVTDVGDSAMLVGDRGFVTQPRDVNALAMSVSKLIAIGSDARRELGLRARAHIVNHLSLGSVTMQYAALYDSVLGQAQRGSLGSSLPEA